MEALLVVVALSALVVGLVLGSLAWHARAWHALRCAWRESSMICARITLSPLVARVREERAEERAGRRSLAGKTWVE